MIYTRHTTGNDDGTFSSTVRQGISTTERNAEGNFITFTIVKHVDGFTTRARATGWAKRQIKALRRAAK